MLEIGKVYQGEGLQVIGELDDAVEEGYTYGNPLFCIMSSWLETLISLPIATRRC